MRNSFAVPGPYGGNRRLCRQGYYKLDVPVRTIVPVSDYIIAADSGIAQSNQAGAAGFERNLS